MKELLEDDQSMLKNYKRGSIMREELLPIYIRNAIAHHGTNKENTFTSQELKASIDFLRKSINKDKTESKGEISK